ncbi:unnamed protein product [Arctia plantaginis]|uniref:EGF-like domain-containing protein n=1 Tax=Arctia plantaginis TaxID=874455 RepID=A0A8S0ZZ66_ARCPL|nr:unnamed protein product [Arctia plantaginis]
MAGLNTVYILMCVVIIFTLMDFCEPQSKDDPHACPVKIASPPGRKKRRNGKLRLPKPTSPQPILYACCKDYSFDDKSKKCVPNCDLECIHGTCVSPNNCECKSGYKFTTNSTHICEPKCNKECNHGTCSALNQCACDPGYKQDPKDIYNCIPVCSLGCINGTCILPNKCECSVGYKFTANSENVCEPKCDKECQNGKCSGPNRCTCYYGYEKDSEDEFKCKPLCSPECVHSKCTAPNNCTCDNGYQKLKMNESMCYKPCETPCHNGFCSLDGQCTCFEGYKFVLDTCIPSLNCSECHGNCTEENGDQQNCRCPDGKPCQANKNNPIEIPEETATVNVDCGDCNGSCEPENGIQQSCRCLDGNPCKNNPIEIPEEITTAEQAGINPIVLVFAAIALVLIVLIIAVIQRIWHKSNNYDSKGSPSNEAAIGSVVYHTFPATLIQPKGHEDTNPNDDPEIDNLTQEEAAIDTLLRRSAEENIS